jgi:hypothetical protein
MMIVVAYPIRMGKIDQLFHFAHRRSRSLFYSLQLLPLRLVETTGLRDFWVQAAEKMQSQVMSAERPCQFVPKQRYLENKRPIWNPV